MSISDFSKEILGSTEDSQSVAGFRGQLCYVVDPGEVLVVDLFQWLTMEIDR